MNDVSISLSVPGVRDRVGRGGTCRPALLTRLLRYVLTGIQRHRQRRALGQLDERLLRDIGITPRQARQEADKPFWRA